MAPTPHNSPTRPPPPQNNDNFEEGLLKLVRTLPKILKVREGNELGGGEQSRCAPCPRKPGQPAEEDEPASTGQQVHSHMHAKSARHAVHTRTQLARCSTHKQGQVPMTPLPTQRAHATYAYSSQYLPSDKARDARNFVNSLQYWLGGNTDNLENLLLNVSSSYVPALKVRRAGRHCMEAVKRPSR